ncbi:MAG TPA: ROK family protein, partial [Gemmatales bacterium]|nr:ROK family protein [Gemmatales bacterium]
MSFLGIEIGGTKLQVALGDGLGSISYQHRVAARPEEGATGIQAQILDAVHTLLKLAGFQSKDVARCGIGFGGPVDDRTRCAIISHQV